MKLSENKGIAIVGLMMIASQAHALSTTYGLNQSNVDAFPLLDGASTYATVKIEDGLTLGSDTNAVRFTVTPNTSILSPTAGSFGIDEFGFNLSSGATAPKVAQIVLSPTNTNWRAIVNVNPTGATNKFDGFANFQIGVKARNAGAGLRLSPLVFYVTGITGDTINSYLSASLGTAGQGNAWFAAHILGFTVSGNTATSAYFGGGNGTTAPPIVSAVPVPAAAVLFAPLLGLLGTIGRIRKAAIVA